MPLLLLLLLPLLLPFPTVGTSAGLSMEDSPAVFFLLLLWLWLWLPSSAPWDLADTLIGPWTSYVGTKRKAGPSTNLSTLPPFMGKGCQFGSRAWLGWFEGKPDIVAGFIGRVMVGLSLGLVDYSVERERERGGAR